MMALFRNLFAAALFVGILAAFEPLNYKDCKSTFKINSVRADGCPQENGKCVFKRGTNPTIKISFIPDRDLPKLKASVRSKISGGSTFTTFSLNNDNACEHGIECPLKAGQTYEYTQSVEIVNTYPVVDDVQVNWVLSDEDDSNKKEICIVFLAKITE
uniref:MD-2-related lipid-recognition domain-containing protein n=1 Tax=Panagrolaimus sp. JU765 TaxID=591449 RepID=A0AC34QX73_9BILA